MADGTWEVTDMGFCEVLTLIFIVLKLCNVISWSWWLVLAPEIVAVSFYLLLFVAVFVFCIFACVIVGARSDKDGDDHET